MEDNLKLAIQQSIEAYLQRDWRKRISNWDLEPHYPGALSLFATANIDGKPKFFRVHIREYHPDPDAPTKPEPLTPEEKEGIEQYIATRVEKAALYRKETFRRLADEWYDATRHSYRISKNLLHPAHRQIIEMGNDILPLILGELRQERQYWFAALTAITGEDPAAEASTPDEMTDAWLAWGEKRGLLSPLE